MVDFGLLRSPLMAKEFVEKGAARGLAQRLAEKLQDPDFELSASMDYAQLQSLNPDLAERMASNFSNLSKKRQKDYIVDMTKVYNALNSGQKDSRARAIEVLDDRIQRVMDMGGDPANSLYVRGLIESDPDYALKGLQNMVRATSGFSLDPREGQSYAPSNLEKTIEYLKTQGFSNEEIRDYINRMSGATAKAGTMTPEERLSLDADAAKSVSDVEQQMSGARERGKNIQKARKEAIDATQNKYEASKSNVASYRSAISQIDQGGETSKIVNSLLPTLTTATSMLESIRGDLALNRLSTVTMGALSQSELDILKETAIPSGSPESVKSWLRNRIAAEEKAMGIAKEAIDWMLKNTEKEPREFWLQQEQQRGQKGSSQGGLTPEQQRELEELRAWRNSRG